MNFLELLRTVYASLARHFVRSLLATLGIILGIAAVVAMLAISEGGKRSALRQIEAQGLHNIVLRSIKPETASKDATDTQSTDSSYIDYGITIEDLEHIKNTFENISEIVPVRNVSATLYGLHRKVDVRVIATTPAFLDVSHSVLTDSRGRFLTEFDRESPSPICVVGRDAARKLFRHLDPLGRDVMIGHVPYKVVGLFENPAENRIAGDHHINNLVIIPLQDREISEPSNNKHIEHTDFDYCYLVADRITPLPATVGRLRTYLAATHDDADYELHVPFELMRSAEKTQRIFTIVMTSIAAISLLVGGIGIMNIMLANIFERTREIGIRRALGAQKSDILVQFLGEAVVLTTTGGILGVAVGIATAKVIEILATAGGNATLQAVVTPGSIIASLAVAVFAGITFGTNPAWKAAQLDPLTALRHE